MQSSSDVLAIIPTYIRDVDDARQTILTYETLKNTCGAQVIVVDDFSPHESLADVVNSLDKEDIFVQRGKNGGFSKTVNVGLQKCLEQKRDALLVNADLIFDDNNWLDYMRDNEESVVGAKLLFPNKTIQHAGIYFSVIRRDYDHRYRLAPGNLALANERAICPVTAALQLIKHECLEGVGLYDENFRMGFEDVDYAHRVFASGRRCVYDPRAVAVHFEGMFRQHDTDQQGVWLDHSWAYLMQKYHGQPLGEYVPTMIFDD